MFAIIGEQASRRHAAPGDSRVCAPPLSFRCQVLVCNIPDGGCTPPVVTTTDNDAFRYGRLRTLIAT